MLFRAIAGRCSDLNTHLLYSQAAPIVSATVHARAPPDILLSGGRGRKLRRVCNRLSKGRVLRCRDEIECHSAGALRYVLLLCKLLRCVETVAEKVTMRFCATSRRCAMFARAIVLFLTSACTDSAPHMNAPRYPSLAPVRLVTLGRQCFMRDECWHLRSLRCQPKPSASSRYWRKRVAIWHPR